MPSFASLGKFFGRTASEGAAFAAGLATAPVLAPVVREIENEANAKYESHPLSAGDAAAIVAENVEQYDFGKAEASYNGVNETRFQALLGEALSAPGVPQLLTLWRRSEITDDDFLHGLRKAKLEDRWDAPLQDLKTDRLDPAVVALGIVRGTVTDPGLLVQTLDTSDSNVPKYTPASFDPLAEAFASGIDTERLRTMVGNVGLPMAVIAAAQAFFRGILTEGGYNQAVLEGDTRPEWGPFILDYARQILTAHDWVELHLRGWITDTEMYAGTALHGMSQADTDRLFRVLGRPLAVHQITTGLARGGTFQPLPGGIQDPYEASVHEANLRPEFYDLAIANKYTIPSYFVFKAILASGGLTVEEVAQYFKELGWPPDLAEKAAAALAPKPPTATDSHVKSSATSLVTSTRKAYIGGSVTRAQAAQALTTAGVTPDNQTALFTLWDAQKTVETAAPAPPVA